MRIVANGRGRVARGEFPKQRATHALNPGLRRGVAGMRGVEEEHAWDYFVLGAVNR